MPSLPWGKVLGTLVGGLIVWGALQLPTPWMLGVLFAMIFACIVLASRNG